MRFFLQKPFWKQHQKRFYHNKQTFLALESPKPSEASLRFSCKGELTESELYNANNKSPGNVGLAKEFYLSFWDIIKDKCTSYI